MRGAIEALGILLVVAGLLAAWLPLGLIAAGGALILAAHDRPPVAQNLLTSAMTGERRRPAA